MVRTRRPNARSRAAACAHSLRNRSRKAHLALRCHAILKARIARQDVLARTGLSNI